MSFYLGQRSMSNLVGIYPSLAYAVTEAIKITHQDFTVFSGIRTVAEQQGLVASGASDTLDSYHLYGLAVDIVAWDRGANFDVEPNKPVRLAMKEVIDVHGMHAECGYDVWGWDIYHWQMSGLKRTYDIRELQ